MLFMLLPHKFAANSPLLGKVVFTSMCQEFCPHRVWPPKHVRWQAGDTHPTGMFSCSK